MSGFDIPHFTPGSAPLHHPWYSIFKVRNLGLGRRAILHLCGDKGYDFAEVYTLAMSD